MLLKITEALSGNPVALFALGAIFVLLSLMAGYFVGVKLSSRKEAPVDDTTAYEGKIQSLIIDYLNLGVIAYDANGAVYSNETLYELSGFLGEQKKIPRDINAFLSAYGENNHLKSDYLLNIENEDSVIRANYVTGRTIYEIKILHRTIGEDRLDIVIIDDITQIKDDERRQKDLAANVSHELKTPLTVIRASEAFVNNITPDKMPDYDAIKRWGNRIIANAVRMQDIVQDFLILSMASQSVRMSILDLEETTQRAINNLNDYPGRDRVDIRFEGNEGHHLIFGNSNLVMRVIINLLTNAVKYISFDGKTEPDIITVRIVTIDDRAGVQVSDNGRGIPQKDIAHLFERFYRVDNSGSRAVGGSGIGLAIAKDVSDMHDGNITVNSKTDQGSSFTFMLPQAKTVFDSVYDDAVTGIVSEKQYYRGAADFIAIQAAEFARSAGYDDVEEKAELYEMTPAGEKTAHDKNLAEFLTALGKERFDELTDELLYVEEDDDEYFDDEFEDEEGIDDDAAASDARTVRKAPTISDELMKELEEDQEAEAEAPKAIGALDKEEARKILTQTILPRSTSVDDKGNTKETVPSDANETGKLYNGNESAVRKVLDETAPLPVQSKPNEEE